MKKTVLVFVGIFLASLMVFLVANLLIINAVPEPKRMTELPQSGYGVGSDEFKSSMQALNQSDVVGGNKIELISGGKNIYAAMMGAIENAEHSITFEKYEFWGEHSGKPMAQAFARAAERGVRIHLLLDYIGSMRAEQSWLDEMEQAGVAVHRFRAPRWYNLTVLNNRTHRKIMVVDGAQAFFGGANVGDDWLAVDGTEPYTDHHFNIQGPMVDDIQSAFIENWLNATGQLIEGAEYFTQSGTPDSEKNDGAGRLQVVTSSPTQGVHRIRAMKLYALASANDYFMATTAYFYPDADFIEALIDARERGVRVKIMMAGEELDKGFIYAAALNKWKPLLESGVKIYMYQPSMYHAKLMVVDDAFATFGSSNLDNRSFRINDEANIAVWDNETVALIRETIEGDLERAEKYTLAQWHARPWYNRLYGHVAALLGWQY